jgi:hypothetical protein
MQLTQLKQVLIDTRAFDDFGEPLMQNLGQSLTFLFSEEGELLI